jgi:hypothetical protein
MLTITLLGHGVKRKNQVAVATKKLGGGLGIRTPSGYSNSRHSECKVRVQFPTGKILRNAAPTTNTILTQFYTLVNTPRIVPGQGCREATSRVRVP